LRPIVKFVDQDHLPEVNPTLLPGKNSCILIYPLSGMILKGYPSKMKKYHQKVKKYQINLIRSDNEIFIIIISFNK